ncbi:hypothetical protein CIRG_00934 [Coccidioides immitis RMSCC 2394]|uniref:Uncharacterized protein n=1 Tax=Coccidioides immitis RMSCC 2394 TaxID=404692 RepID=A0A0J7AU15_COCIT|nr:hypothetical protein CIRG_00934 [Coccidioides immitis RMSCC 2394]
MPRSATCDTPAAKRHTVFGYDTCNVRSRPVSNGPEITRESPLRSLFGHDRDADKTATTMSMAALRHHHRPCSSISLPIDIVRPLTWATLIGLIDANGQSTPPQQCHLRQPV